jgi:hypothetical protein
MRIVTYRYVSLVVASGLFLVAACGGPAPTAGGSTDSPSPATAAGGSTSLPAPTTTGASPTLTGPTAVSHPTTAVTDLVSFIDAAQASGLSVSQSGTVSQPFFAVEGTVVTVDGADVQVFEFADAEDAQAAVAALGPDGNPPTMMIEWVAPPHFYQAGRLVVLYLGDDPELLQALSDLLGPQVAGR